MASLSAMINSLDAQEKTKKPKLTRTQTIQHLCFMNDQRT